MAHDQLHTTRLHRQLHIDKRPKIEYESGEVLWWSEISDVEDLCVVSVCPCL